MQSMLSFSCLFLGVNVSTYTMQKSWHLEEVRAVDESISTKETLGSVWAWKCERVQC